MYYEKKLNKLVVISSLFLLPIIILCCSTNPVDRVKTLEQALNSHHIEGYLALFTDDISFRLGGYADEGIQELRKVAEWDSVLNSDYSFTDIRMVGDTVICKCAEVNELINLMGIEIGTYDSVKIVFNDGLIKYMSFEMTMECYEADKKAWSSLMDWATKERSQQLTRLMPEGKFVVNATSANGWLALFREWRKATSQK